MSFSDITSAITGALTGPANKAKLDLALDSLKTFEKKVADLERENSELRNQIKEAQSRLVDQDRRAEFEEHRSFLFRKGAKERTAKAHEEVVHCPACLLPMFSRPGEGWMHPLSCRCGMRTPFRQADIEFILKAII